MPAGCHTALRYTSPMANPPLATRRLDAARDADIAEAVRLLHAGRLVAVPTETVYGLAADATNPEAVRGIFAAKGRPSNHPLIVHLGDPAWLDTWAREVPETARRLAAAFWPGPLTLLLHKAAAVPSDVTGGRDTIGLRMPDHPVLLGVLRALGHGVAAPSANPYKRLSPTTADQVLAGLEGRIDAVLDGGPCAVGLESTIVDLTDDVPRILRAGPITHRQLEDVLGVTVEFPESHDAAVPGNVAVHYQPRTPLHVLETETLRARLAALPADTRIALLAHTRGLPAHATALHIEMPHDKAGYARRLYDALHTADAAEVDAIWLERPPGDDDWRDVHDRLARAASRGD